MKPNAGFLELEHRSARLTLEPCRGGAIREFRAAGVNPGERIAIAIQFEIGAS
jgi:hypothetical protein